LPSDFVDGVTDFCVPIRGRQGALAVLVVPYISIKSMPMEPNRVRERLLAAAQRIADALVDEGR